MSDFHPVDGDKWFSEIQAAFLAEKREELAEQYGEGAIESVMKMTALFADLIHIGSDHIPLIKAGIHRVAELVNEMLPRLNGPSGITRAYGPEDLNGVLDPMPEEVQSVFLVLVGDTLIHSKGGPFETATILAESVDSLAIVLRSEGQGL